MGREKKRRQANAQRPARIGPFGPGVRIRFSEHAEERFLQRLAELERQDFEAAIREPNTKKKDEHDPEPPKIRRWVTVRINGIFTTVRVVFAVISEKTLADSGEIRVVTVIPEAS